jgi:hypothetical protein
LDLNSSCSPIGSVESRKVFEDATAFVRVSPLHSSSSLPLSLLSLET